MSKLYVSMGRAGDLLSQIPILHSEYEKTGQKPRMMVAKEFASILNGCSYIDPVIYDGDFLELEKAVGVARGLSDEVAVLSIHGETNAVKDLAYKQVGAGHRVTTSFQLEPWKLAGRLNDFYENLPLVFDQRNPEREDRLLRANGFKVKGKRKPVILLALGGINCPFPYADLLRELVTAKFSADYRIIDLPMVEQPDGRIYDLLAIYENAALLITTDSMPLHLAWACRSLPVFALTNDRTPKGQPSLWHGSVWRPNHLWFSRYHDWPERAVEMCEAIDAFTEAKEHNKKEFTGDTRVSVWLEETFQKGPVYCPNPRVLAVTQGMCSRYSNGFPYLRDIIRMGLQRSKEDGMGLCRKYVRWFQMSEGPINKPLFAYRQHKSQHIPIVDLFSASKEFWKRILPEIPDLVLDNDDSMWSQALWAIFRKHGASDASGVCEFTGGGK